jgi:hypothetical protein
MPIHAHQTKAYGQWRAVAVAADGTEHEGWGLTQLQAEFRAHLKATAEPCTGCGRPISQPEAQVSRRALGSALCGPCREGRRPAGHYDSSDPER